MQLLRARANKASLINYYYQQTKGNPLRPQSRGIRSHRGKWFLSYALAGTIRLRRPTGAKRCRPC